MSEPLIGLIVKNSKGKFVPLIGNKIESPGDNDQFVNIVGSQKPQDTLEAAQQFLKDEDENLVEVYMTPRGPVAGGVIWVSTLGENSKGKV